MITNNINYNFSEEEVIAVASLVKFANNMGDRDIKQIAIIVATAFNREAFNQLKQSND